MMGECSLYIRLGTFSTPNIKQKPGSRKSRVTCPIESCLERRSTENVKNTELDYRIIFYYFGCTV